MVIKTVETKSYYFVGQLEVNTIILHMLSEVNLQVSLLGTKWWESDKVMGWGTS